MNYRLTEDEANELANALAGPARTNGPIAPTTAFLEAIQAFPRDLVAELRTVAAGRAEEGVVLIENLPVGQLGPTPASDDDYFADSGRDGLTERVLLGAAELVGTTFAYANERRGVLLTNIIPTESDRDVQSSNGSSRLLPFHTEDVHQHPYNPDYVMLFCLRDEPGKTVSTNVIDPSRVIADLPQDTVTILREAAFVTTPPPIYAGRMSRDPKPVPIVSGEGSATQVLVEFNDTTATHEAARAALSQLREACTASEHVIELCLKPGQLAILDNRRVLHGRGAFESDFGPNRRWLQRVKVKAGGLWPFGDFVDNTNQRLIHL